MSDCSCGDWSADYDTDPLGYSYEATASYDDSDVYQTVSYDYSDSSPVQNDYTYDTGTVIDDSQSIFTEAMQPSEYDTGGGVVISNEGSIFDQAMQPSDYDTGGGVVLPLEGSFFDPANMPNSAPAADLDGLIAAIDEMPSQPSAAGTPYVGPTFGPSVGDVIDGIGYMNDTWTQPPGITIDSHGTYWDDSGRSADADLYSPVENEFGTYDVN